MFIAAMSTIAKLWKEPRCPPKGEWIKKGVVYFYNGMLVIRNHKYPRLALKSMELVGIMLCEISQSVKDKPYMVSFIWGI